MNTQTGKSVGIALLLAAGLLAALFAMGVFAPAGLDARVATGDDAPTVSLLGSDGNPLTLDSDSRTGGSIVVNFQVDDDVDGLFEGGESSDSVVITVASDLISAIDSNGTTLTGVTAKQGGVDVGAVTATGTAADGLTITIAKATVSGRGNLAKDVMATVTIPAIEFPGTAATLGDNPDTTAVETDFVTAQGTPFGGTVTVQQNPFTTMHEVMAAVFDPVKTFTAAEADRAIVNGAFGLRVKFTARMASASGDDEFDVLITMPKELTGTPAISDPTGVTSETGTASTATTPGSIELSAFPMGAVQVDITGLSGPENWDGLEVMLSQGTHFTAMVPIGGPAVQGPDAPDTADPDADDTDAVLSSDKADAAVTVTVASMAGASNPIAGGRDIVVTLTGFQIPDSIDEDTVIIDGMGTGAVGSATAEYYGNPASIAISGSSITLSLPTRIAATGATIDSIKGDYEITFKQSAGIKNPNSAGSKTITVKDLDTTADELMVTIVSHISAKPVWVSRGNAVTVTGKGINSTGTVTLHLYEGDEDVGDLTGGDLTGSLVLGSARMDDGTAVVEFDATSSRLMAEATPATDDASAGATNTIVMVDAGGNVVGHTNIGIKPSVKLDVTEVRRSGRMKVSVSDWYYGDIDDIRVNGIQVDLPDGPDADDIAEDWELQEVPGTKLDDLVVIVDRTVRLGEMEVVVYGTTYDMQGTLGSQDKDTQTVDVGVFDLSVTPSTAVTDQVIRLEGTGFLPRACITSIMVGEQPINEATTGDDVGGDERDCVDTDSNGKLADSFHVPFGLSPGTYRLVVRDEGNRVGEADLVVPKPAITLDPDMGQRGDTVVVEGSNFPAEDLVTVRYRGVAVASGTTDTVGQFRATFTVPITAPIGATHEVLAKSENKGDGTTVDGVTRANLSATADHEVPDETLELSPETVAAGGRLTVTGGNLPLFTPVTVRIGGIAAAGRAIGEDDASDGSGRYERVILVPQLTPGTHTVELTAHARNEDISVARFVVVADIVTRPTAEVFEDLIAANQLTVVWRYDNATASWASYDPTAPAELNDLNLVSTDDIVWLQLTEGAEFQGRNLNAGWSLITLE